MIKQVKALRTKSTLLVFVPLTGGKKNTGNNLKEVVVMLLLNNRQNLFLISNTLFNLVVTEYILTCQVLV